MNTTEKVKSNAEVHGLRFAAKRYKVEAKRQGKVGNFDAFYFVFFKKYPRK